MGDKGKYLENEEGCFICGKRPTQWKLIGGQGKKFSLCKRHYSHPKITDIKWINRRLWYHKTKGGDKGKRCYLCGKPVVANIDIALDKALAEGLPADDLTTDGLQEEWLQNVQQVCIDHYMPESRVGLLAKSKDTSRRQKGNK